MLLERGACGGGCKINEIYVLKDERRVCAMVCKGMQEEALSERVAWGK